MDRLPLGWALAIAVLATVVAGWRSGLDFTCRPVCRPCAPAPCMPPAQAELRRGARHPDAGCLEERAARRGGPAALATQDRRSSEG